jgi:hypothetical protein
MPTMGRRPELVAIALMLVVLAVLFVVFLAASIGVGAWIVLGLFFAVLIVGAGLYFVRRPRGGAAFEGGAAPVSDGVHRVLLVVDDACSADTLAALGHDGDTAVFVVAPAVSSRTARLTGDEHAYGRAEEHLNETVAALQELGVEARGQVGSHDPVQAADDGLRAFPADEIVFALHGGDDTDWVERGVVELARARYAVPVRELAR